jgi:hypothetical protein
MQAVLNQDGQRKYTIKADRAAAYGHFLATNPGLNWPIGVVQAYLNGRVPGTTNAQIRAGVGYASTIKRAWDWPRGVLAAYLVLHQEMPVRAYSATR